MEDENGKKDRSTEIESKTTLKLVWLINENICMCTYLTYFIGREN